MVVASQRLQVVRDQRLESLLSCIVLLSAGAAPLSVSSRDLLSLVVEHKDKLDQQQSERSEVLVCPASAILVLQTSPYRYTRGQRLH